MLPFKTKRDLYYAVIIPHFNYCAEMWHHCSNKCTSMLEKVNERAIRFIFNDRSEPYRELLEKLGLPTLLNQRLLKIVCTVLKTINRPESPRSIHDLINRRNTTYSLRGQDMLQQPKVNTTTYGLRSWRHSASKLWNKLPNRLKALDTYSTFKTQLKKLDLTGISFSRSTIELNSTISFYSGRRRRVIKWAPFVLFFSL